MIFMAYASETKSRDISQIADEYWEKFTKSGSVSSYLKYKTYTNANKKDGETVGYR